MFVEFAHAKPAPVTEQTGSGLTLNKALLEVAVPQKLLKTA